MNNLEIRHEIATLRAAMLEIVHRLEKLSAACVAPPPREVIHTRRVICVECGGTDLDDLKDNLLAPQIDVFGTMIRVTPIEAEIMSLLLKRPGKPVAYQTFGHAIYSDRLHFAPARKEYVENERRNLHVHMSRLRGKMRKAQVPGEIVNHFDFGMELRQATVNRSKVAA
jgi:DNA-binding response OmpR family regulator